MAYLDLTPASLNLKVYRGDTTNMTLTFKDNGSTMSLPSVGWEGQVRDAVNGDNVLGVIVVDATYASTGVLTLTLPDIDYPDKCYYDVQSTVPDTRTWIYGEINVIGQVTV